MKNSFWSVFPRIWTEHGDLRSKSPHLVQIRENTGPEKTPYLEIFEAVQVKEKNSCTRKAIG